MAALEPKTPETSAPVLMETTTTSDTIEVKAITVGSPTGIEITPDSNVGTPFVMPVKTLYPPAIRTLYAALRYLAAQSLNPTALAGFRSSFPELWDV
jgi:hypothetical protein